MSNIKIIKPLKGHNIFSDVFKVAYKKRSSKLLIAYTYYSAENCSNNMFLGVSVPKKIVKKAVCRNRVKRLMRESIRQIQIEDIELIKEINQLILVWQETLEQPSRLKLSIVKEEVKDLLKSALIKKNETDINSNNKIL